MPHMPVYRFICCMLVNGGSNDDAKVRCIVMLFMPTAITGFPAECLEVRNEYISSCACQLQCWCLGPWKRVLHPDHTNHCLWGYSTICSPTLALPFAEHTPSDLLYTILFHFPYAVVELSPPHMHTHTQTHSHIHKHTYMHTIHTHTQTGWPMYYTPQKPLIC